MTDDELKPPKSSSQWPRLIIQCLISIAGLSLLVWHYVFPTARIDTISVALLLIAALPWLGMVFKSVEVPRLGKVEYLERAIRNQEAGLRSAENVATATSELVMTLTGQPTTRDLGAVELQQLADKYIAARASRPRGWERTAEVTRIFGQMTAAALHNVGFDARAALHSSDAGQRLAGIAFLYARPDPTMLEDLVGVITDKEDKGFNQYWGIKAIGKILSLQVRPSGMILNKLAQFADRVEEGTDRKYELRKLLQEFQ